MYVQWSLVGVVVALSLVYLGRQTWRTWAGSGCNGGCHCGAKKADEPGLISSDDLVARVRDRRLGGQGRG